MLYSYDHNNAFVYNRELPAKFVKQGYDVINLSIDLSIFRNIEELIKSLDSKLSGIFLFANGEEINNHHHHSFYSTVDFLSKLRKSIPENHVNPEGVNLIIESCHSGALDFIKLKENFPEINKLFISDTLNSPSNAVLYLDDCAKFMQLSEINPIDAFASCTKEYDYVLRSHKSFVDLSSQNVQEFIERNGYKELSQHDKTCFHRIYSEPPYKYSDELVTECKAYFETQEA